mgnify:CR=1 FL=1
MRKISKTYELAKQFKRKYPLTIAWRIKQHCKVIDTHLNPGEEVLYVFMGQKNLSSFDFVNTNLVVLTTKRLMIATKRLLFGYFFIAVTPDMFNDLTVIDGIIWGKIKIDTIKEEVLLSNIDPKALPEIETKVSDYMIKEKRRYAQRSGV